MEKIHKEYHDTGQVKLIEYLRNDKLHNENGPSLIVYDEDGIKLADSYYINDLKHRIDGPSFNPYIEESIFIPLWYYKNIDYTNEVNEWMSQNKFDKWEDMCDDDFNRMWTEIL